MYKTLIVTGVHKEEAEAGRKLVQRILGERSITPYEIKNPTSAQSRPDHDSKHNSAIYRDEVLSIAREIKPVSVLDIHFGCRSKYGLDLMTASPELYGSLRHGFDVYDERKPSQGGEVRVYRLVDASDPRLKTCTFEPRNRKEWERLVDSIGKYTIVNLGDRLGDVGPLQHDTALENCVRESGGFPVEDGGFLPAELWKDSPWVFTVVEVCGTYPAHEPKTDREWEFVSQAVKDIIALSKKAQPK